MLYTLVVVGLQTRAYLSSCLCPAWQGATLLLLTLHDRGQGVSKVIPFLFCVQHYRAIQISSPVDVMNRAVSSRSAAVPHSLVLRSAPTGQVWFLWAVNSGQSCKMCSGVWSACVLRSVNSHWPGLVPLGCEQ